MERPPFICKKAPIVQKGVFMDKLSHLLQNLEINAEVFFSGNLCGIQRFDDNEESGFLHLVQSGSLTLKTEQEHSLKMHAGSVIFFPNGISHQIEIAKSEDAQMICAAIKLPSSQHKQLISHLPKFLYFNKLEEQETTDTVEKIFMEGFAEKQGRKIMIDRLCDIFMVQTLRKVVEQGTIELGLIAAQSHPQLARLIEAIQKQPEREWSLEEMAESAAMSRSKFALVFKETVGQAPMGYVTSLRMAMAKGLLQQNKPVSLIANEVGYENSSSLAKVFKKHFGITPKKWLQEHLKSR